VAEPTFTPSFLKRVTDLEKNASAIEQPLLEPTLARILIDPYLPERFPALYDPVLPTFLTARGHF
jgi:hypothetical protein